VMNVAHGHPDEHPLPFDLQHFRRPIFFDCPEDADEVARRAAREDLAGKLVVAFRAILEDTALRAAKVPDRPVEPHPEDVALFARFRELITPAHLRFQRDTSFRGPLCRDNLNPVYEIAEDWIGARYEFHDDVIQAAFAEVRRAADALGGLMHAHLYMSDTMQGMMTPLTDRDRAQGTQPATVEAIGKMDAGATALVDAVDAFERVARDRIRVTAGNAADAGAQRDALVARAGDILNEMAQHRGMGRVPGLVSRPCVMLRAVPFSALEGRRLDAGQVAKAQLLFPPDANVRVETGTDGDQWWSIEPGRDVGHHNPESRWRTRLVRPGAIEIEAMIGERLDNDPEIVIDGLSLEAMIVGAFARLGAALAELGLVGPTLLSIAFDGTEDVELSRARPGGRKMRVPGFAMPFVLVDTLDGSVGDALHDAFDRMWQRSGWADGSPSFSTGYWRSSRD